LKANFSIKKNTDLGKKLPDVESSTNKEITEEEFEDFIVKAGAAGSFMVFRSLKKEDELGLDEL
jgi:hypothetical protein|tara:strand:- start:2535 stop:2726 length:192 start_codon:yes stop_codon:yes gene_type:complete